MVRSNAYDCPADQLGKYMSPALSYYLKSNFSVRRRVISLRSSKQQIFYPSLNRAAISYPPKMTALSVITQLVQSAVLIVRAFLFPNV